MKKFILLFYYFIILLFFIITVANVNILANTSLGELAFVFKSKYDLHNNCKEIQTSIKGANYKVYKPKKLLEPLSF